MRGEHLENIHKELIIVNYIKTRLKESTYQKHLESILDGKHVDYGIYGVSDITTDILHAEIKSWKSWKNVIGQLLSYNRASCFSLSFVFYCQAYEKVCL